MYVHDPQNKNLEINQSNFQWHSTYSVKTPFQCHQSISSFPAYALNQLLIFLCGEIIETIILQVSEQAQPDLIYHSFLSHCLDWPRIIRSSHGDDPWLTCSRWSISVHQPETADNLSWSSQVRQFHNSKLSSIY